MKLILESDGTEMDGESLQFFSSETMLLLTKDEVWLPNNYVASSDSTLSYDEDISQPTSLVNQALTDEQVWLDFKIPWGKMDDDVIKECEKGNKNKRITTYVVDTIVNEMRKYKKIIPSKAFRIISTKVIEIYPNMFRDVDDDNVVFGEGTYTFSKKMTDRNNYLNRPHVKRSILHDFEIKIDKRRKMNVAKAGCSNWQPDDYPEKETETSLEEKRIFLKNAAKNETQDEEKILNYLNITYVCFRKEINFKNPTVEALKNDWPIIFKQKYLFWHYTKLMGHSIEILAENFRQKKSTILKFGIQKKYINSEDSSDRHVLDTISKHFKEDIHTFLLKYEVRNYMIIFIKYVK